MKMSDYLMRLAFGTDIKLCANKGYVLTPNCIRRCIRVSQEEKLVLFEIVSHYNDEKGYAFPTQQTLALYLGITPSTVSKHLKNLELKGFIKSKGGMGKKKRYYPSFDLQNNEYLILSEWFFFAVNVIRNKLDETIGAEWANQLLLYVNNTKDDNLGEFLIKLKKNMGFAFEEEIIIEFLNHLKEYAERLTIQSLDICWELEIETAIVTTKESMKTTKYKKNRTVKNGKLELPSSGDDYDMFS